MNFTVSLDTERILENIYAYSALGYFSASATEKPEVLGRGQKTALLNIILNRAVQIVYELSPFVAATSLVDSPDRTDIITIEFGLPDTTKGHEVLHLRPLLEGAVASAVLASAWCTVNAGVCDRFNAMLCENMTKIRSSRVFRGKPGRIVPAA